MKIFVNDNPIDFELTQEETVNDVLQALQDWVTEQNLFLNRILIDDEIVDGFDYNQNPRQTQVSKSLEQIQEIRCEVLSAVAYVVSVWSELKLCFAPFKEIRLEEVEQQSDDMLARIDWSKSIIAKINQFFSSSKESAPLLKLIKALELEIFKLKKNPKPQDSKDEIEVLTKIIIQIEQEVEQGLFLLNTKVIKSGLKDDPVAVRHSIENYLIYLELVEEKLVEVAIHFQKTEIPQGFAALVSVTDGLGIFFVLSKQIEGVMRSLDNINSEHQLEDTEERKYNLLVEEGNVVQAQLKEHLDALQEAIANNDYIDAADIVEYEIKELIPKTRELLAKHLSLSNW